MNDSDDNVGFLDMAKDTFGKIGDFFSGTNEKAGGPSLHGAVVDTQNVASNASTAVGDDNYVGMELGSATELLTHSKLMGAAVGLMGKFAHHAGLLGFLDNKTMKTIGGLAIGAETLRLGMEAFGKLSGMGGFGGKVMEIGAIVAIGVAMWKYGPQLMAGLKHMTGSPDTAPSNA